MPAAPQTKGLSERPGPVDKHPDPDPLAARAPGRQPQPTTAVDPPMDPSATRPWAQTVLREVGLLVTRPRLLVLAALRGRARPVTAQDLHRELATRLHESPAQEAMPEVTTVYRTLAALAALAERGVLHCFPQDRAVTAYRLCPPVRHHHLVCRSCGWVQEQPSGPALECIAALVTGAEFTIEDYRAELVGLCAQCQQDPTPPRQAAQPNGSP